MQDWSMIPLHVRCTERWKIDPTYPDDDAKWWKFQEGRPTEKRMEFEMYVDKGSEKQRRAWEIVKEHGEIAVHVLAEKMGTDVPRARFALDGLSKMYPLYSYVHRDKSHTYTIYGALT